MEERLGGRIITSPSFGGEALRPRLPLSVQSCLRGRDWLFKISASRSIMYDQTIEVAGLQVFNDGPPIFRWQLTSQDAMTTPAFATWDVGEFVPSIPVPRELCPEFKPSQRIAAGR